MVNNMENIAVLAGQECFWMDFKCSMLQSFHTKKNLFYLVSEKRKREREREM
jgi:hypothetical protein